MNGVALLRLALCVLLCAAIAALGGWTTAPQIAGWYATLRKPAWTPPNEAFPVAWTLLYACIAVALYLLWDRTVPTLRRRWALGLFLLQLALNALWSPVFFGLHATQRGLAIISALVVALAATIIAAWRPHRVAATLLLPYFVWVAYAASLNAGLVALNPG